MTNYSRGVSLERAVAERLRREGWLAVRAAGSHGVADVVALLLGQAPRLIQCKIDGYLVPAERRSLLEAAAAAGAEPVVAWRGPGRSGLQLARLNADHSRTALGWGPHPEEVSA